MMRTIRNVNLSRHHHQTTAMLASFSRNSGVKVWIKGPTPGLELVLWMKLWTPWSTSAGIKQNTHFLERVWGSSRRKSIQDSPCKVSKILPHTTSDKYVFGETLESSRKFPDREKKPTASEDSAEDDVPPEQHGGGKLWDGLLRRAGVQPSGEK